MTAPKDLPYTIASRELVAQTPGMRVQVLTLAPGEIIPWHYHTTVYDIFVGLEGTTIVETGMSGARSELAPGQHCVVAPMTAHQVTGKNGKGCRFTIVQGVGEHDFNLVARVAATQGQN